MRIAFDTQGKTAPIGHFRVVLCLCQNESSCETIHNAFLYRFSSMKTEAQDNKEMAYSTDFLSNTLTIRPTNRDFPKSCKVIVSIVQHSRETKWIFKKWKEDDKRKRASTFRPLMAKCNFLWRFESLKLEKFCMTLPSGNLSLHKSL